MRIKEKNGGCTVVSTSDVIGASFNSGLSNYASLVIQALEKSFTVKFFSDDDHGGCLEEFKKLTSTGRWLKCAIHPRFINLDKVNLIRVLQDSEDEWIVKFYRSDGLHPIVWTDYETQEQALSVVGGNESWF